MKRKFITTMIISGLMVSSLIAGEINSVDFIKYPLDKSLTSKSRGGDLPDKIAATDGIGNLVLKKIDRDNSKLDNSTYNKLLRENLSKLDDNNTLNDLINSGKVVISQKKLDEINDNIAKLTYSPGTCYGADIGSTVNGQLVVDKHMLKTMYLNGDDITNVCTSNITDMSNFFQKDYNSFNQPIGNWDVSHVTNMRHMFASALNGHLTNFNQDLSKWNVSNVTDMNNMFGSTKFNQDISSWNTSNVIDMSNMFMYSHFNQNISNWKTDKVKGHTYFSYKGWLSAANSPF